MRRHTICHVEWASTDLQRSEAFFGGLFNWLFEPFGEDYVLFHSPGGIDGGLMKAEEVKPGRSPTVYVRVEEIEPYLEQAEALGGSVKVPKTEIPTVGWYAHLGDPDGNIVGLFQGTWGDTLEAEALAVAVAPQDRSR